MLDGIATENNKRSRHIYELIRVLEYATSETDAVRVGELLNDEGIVGDSDRSNKNNLLCIINKIGTLANVPQLRKFAEMSLETEYTQNVDKSRGSFNRMDAMDAINSLLYISARVSKEERLIISKAISHIKRIVKSSGYPAINSSEIDALKSYVNRKKLTDLFEMSFDDSAADDDTVDRDGSSKSPWYSKSSIDNQIYNENQSPSEDSESESSPVMQLEAPIKILIEKLQENIRSGEYKYVIGDDASGRIPALIIQRLLKKIYTSKKFDGPEVYFIAGSGSSRPEEAQQQKKDKIEEYVGSYLKKIPDKSGKVLIVTEAIAGGTSLRPLTSVLRKFDTEFDIASVGFDGSYPEIAEERLGTKFVYGMLGTPEIYQDKDSSGVTKHYDDLLSRRSDAYYPRLVAGARADVTKLAEILCDWYSKTYDNKIKPRKQV